MAAPRPPGDRTRTAAPGRSAPCGAAARPGGRSRPSPSPPGGAGLKSSMASEAMVVPQASACWTIASARPAAAGHPTQEAAGEGIAGAGGIPDGVHREGRGDEALRRPCGRGPRARPS